VTEKRRQWETEERKGKYRDGRRKAGKVLQQLLLIKATKANKEIKNVYIFSPHPKGRLHHRWHRPPLIADSFFCKVHSGDKKAF